MRRDVVAAAAILVILLVGLGSSFIQQGFTHVLPASMLRWSRDRWDQGMYVESLRWFVRSHEDALDAGLRWWAARPYLNRVQELQYTGKLEEALKNCIRAVAILDGHDNEGQVSYACTTIEVLISTQN
jgi:hypothetical protein